MTFTTTSRRLAAAATVLALSIAGIVAAPVAANAATPVDFAGNAALKACVIDTLNYGPNVVIFPLDLSGLTGFQCRDKNITNLAPLKYATNLTSLDLTNNLVSDLTPIAGLTKLTSLILGKNSISNIAPLHNLTKVESLDLNTNAVTTILPLVGLNALTVVDLHENPLSGIGAVLDLPALTGIGVGSTGAFAPVDLTPLAWLPQLQTLLIDGVRQQDMAAITNHPKLINLLLRGGTLTSVTPLAGLSKLEVLDVSDNQLTDVSALAGLTSLTQLSIADNKVTSAAPLSSLSNLQSLKLVGNGLTSLPTLSKMVSLIELLIDDNSIADLSPVASVPSLTYLYATGNRIKSVAPLSGLGNLKMVRLRENAITDISPFLKMSELGDFDVVDQRIVAADAAINVPTGIPTIVGSKTDVPELTITQGAGQLVPGQVTWNATGAGIISWGLMVNTGHGSGQFSGTIAQNTVIPAAVPLTFGKKLTVKIIGTAKVGKKLTAKVGKPASAVKLAYRWYLNGHAIKKATKSTYKLTKATKHKKITVRVTASKTGYVTVVAKSKATKAIA